MLGQQQSNAPEMFLQKTFKLLYFFARFQCWMKGSYKIAQINPEKTRVRLRSFIFIPTQERLLDRRIFTLSFLFFWSEATWNAKVYFLMTVKVCYGQQLFNSLGRWISHRLAIFRCSVTFNGWLKHGIWNYPSHINLLDSCWYNLRFVFI